MELSAFALIVPMVMIIVYALYKVVKFFATEDKDYEYRTVMDEQGNKYELVVDVNSNTKEKE